MTFRSLKMNRGESSIRLLRQSCFFSARTPLPSNHPDKYFLVQKSETNKFKWNRLFNHRYRVIHCSDERVRAGSTAGITGAHPSFTQTSATAEVWLMSPVRTLPSSNGRHQPHASTRLLTSFLDAANGPQLRTAALVQDLRQTTVNSL